MSDRDAKVTENAAPGAQHDDSDAQPVNAAQDERRATDRRGDDRDPESVDTGRVRAAIRKEISADEQSDSANPAPPEGEAVIELRDVSLAFDRPILAGVSFAVHAGETVAVVGESGTGKSTIIKLILRLLVADRGEVCVLGNDIERLTYEQALEIRQHMGMVFQGSALFDSLTVFENIAYPLREHTDLDDEQIEQRVREKLQFVDLDPDQVMALAPSELSGGMQKRVGVARGLAANPKIMLYDEPTSGLDPLTTGTITNLIMKLQRELNVTSVVVTHDIRSAFRMASKIALLHDQRIVYFGSPEEMAASDDEYIQTFLGGY
ncbi:MAG TPA: ABC transporter ATP-binding protein [Gemmatimonadaceae bacterium]|jgi:phospholipid/cholesterol/gamma-HCH transport system ATP-binding protein